MVPEPPICHRKKPRSRSSFLRHRFSCKRELRGKPSQLLLPFSVRPNIKIIFRKTSLFFKARIADAYRIRHRFSCKRELRGKPSLLHTTFSVRPNIKIIFRKTSLFFKARIADVYRIFHRSSCKRELRGKPSLLHPTFSSGRISKSSFEKRVSFSRHGSRTHTVSAIDSFVKGS